MARHFTLSFADLSMEKQQDLIGAIKKTLLEQFETEGRDFLAREWHDPKPQTWQEAYCRMYAVDHILWNDVDTLEGMAKIDWQTSVDMKADEVAEEKCSNGMNGMQITVEV